DGLEPHPAAIEEQKRIAALRQLDPQGGTAAAAPAAPRSQMSDRTRQTLRQLAEDMRLATERPDGLGTGRPGTAPTPGTSKPGRRAGSGRFFEPASAVQSPAERQP